MNNAYDRQLKELLMLAFKKEASDLHFSVNHPPILRIGGKLVLVKVGDNKKLNSDDTKGFATSLMTESQMQRLMEEKDVDFSYKLEDVARFRVNIFFQSGSISCALRQIPARIRTIEELNLPPILHKFTEAPQGFVLITGPSSQGKSTTMAALIEEINHQRTDHIITIEDPIEYVFSDDRAIIDQREVYQDATSFPTALRATFRQDPNVIMVGEMRDAETIGTAISAAETGHLVFATLHTNDAAQTIHRVVDSFPGEQQNQIRAQLSSSLLGIISQRLIRRVSGGLIPACEVLIANAAVSNLIRENKVHEIPLVIETSTDTGMISLNRSLTFLVKKGEISEKDALNYSLHPEELKMLLK